MAPPLLWGHSPARNIGRCCPVQRQSYLPAYRYRENLYVGIIFANNKVRAPVSDKIQVFFIQYIIYYQFTHFAGAGASYLYPKRAAKQVHIHPVTEIFLNIRIKCLRQCLYSNFQDRMNALHAAYS